jgi:hypothetical protein
MLLPMPEPRQSSSLFSPGHLPLLISPEHPSVDFEALDPEAPFPIRAHGDQVSDFQMLPLKKNALRIGHAQVIDPTVAVATLLLASHLHQPGPDLLRLYLDGDGSAR